MNLVTLLLAFFVWAVWQMDGPGLEGFLDSPFSVLADVRMYLFFARISGLALGVILVLAGLSLVVQNFWCRYLCPYGALLGFLSLASPLRVTRAKATCIDCGLGTKACPSRIQVHLAGRVGSDITLKAVEMVGTIGYSEDTLLEKWARDSKIMDIFEGTQQIQQLVIARNLLGKSSSDLK